MKPSVVLGCVTALCLTAAPLGAAEPAGKKSRSAKDTHWAFQPLKRPALPAPKDRSWVRTPIDAFVLTRLEEEGLKPAPPADRRTLLRRVYLDLIGLPPTPAEQEAFLKDPSPEAFARVVDDLLSRPQYGERWARHWLDVVRYAESNGYERDGAKPSAWRYRDYVIDSLNKDKPYDRFLTEQLAGDEVDGSNAETQIATTFLRLGTWDDEPAEFMLDRYEQLDDVLGTTASAFLGVTLRCARCHDHKFEPFSQADYYKMLAVFEPLKRPQHIVSATHRKEYELPVGSEAELKRHCRTVASQTFGLLGLAVSRPNLALPPFIWHSAQTKELPRAHIWYEDSPTAPPTRILRRGDPFKPLQEVQPGLPDVLVRQAVEPPRPRPRSTGRRLWLANWLTRPDHPLTARVLVNRVWQHHFGRGIVATPNDFGVMGESASHADLLDWLAAQFVADGWKMKSLHRLIALSNTYQMAASRNSQAAEVDPTNTLFWRWPQRRLEAEAVRDSTLAVSGRLNPQMGGPSIYPTLPRAVLEGQSRPGDGWGKSDERQAARRSIYIFVKRVLAVPELELLDAPDTNISCEKRPVSTTGPQALTFLNGDFAQQQARQFAARLQREAGDDAKAQVRRAFLLALCRPPRAEELRASVDFLAKQQKLIAADAVKETDARQKVLAAFCLVLLNTNEFVYVD